MDQLPVYFVLSLPTVGAVAMFAIGVVVIFQASRVLNLAHGAMAMVPPFLLYELSTRGVPLVAALPLAVAAGGLIGMAVERLFVRSLRRQGPTGQTVGTVAALGLLLAGAIRTWGSTPRSAVRVFPDGGVEVGASTLSYGQIGLCVVAVGAMAAFFALFRFTNLGLAMRLAAESRRAASLMGVNPDRTTQVAWLLGGSLAAMAGILLATVTTLHPVNLSLVVLPAFVAALIGGLASLPGALVGSAVVGLVFGMVPALSLAPGLRTFAVQSGAPQLVLAILALVVMALRGARFVGTDVRADLGTPMPAGPQKAEESGGEGQGTAGRRVGRLARRAVPVAALLLWPFLGLPSSWLGDAINAAVYTVVAVSLVLLTGWVGQISLAQASFVGLGAFSTAYFSRHLGLDFPGSLPVAVLVGGGVAAALGFVALRVRGLYLAVATLIFLWMANEFLFRASWFVPPGGASLDPQRIGATDAIPYFDFTERRTFYFVALAVAAAVLWGAANLRDSKTGRAFFAVRGSETAAASLGVNVTRYKLLAFAISGALAGVAGNLLMVHRGAISPSEFTFSASLFYLGIAVVGGLTSLGGAVAASVLFALLNEVFFRCSSGCDLGPLPLPALAGWLEVVSAGLLATALLVRPGGLASLAPAIRGRSRALAQRLGPIAAPVLSSLGGHAVAADLVERVETIEASTDGHRRAGIDAGRLAPFTLPPERSARRPVLAVGRLTVRFGGLTAVDDVSLEVCDGEIVGLIGPNGAGKTTVFNAISGLNEPAAGWVMMFGEDVTNLAVHERAGLGLARTFQVIQLFPQLSVFDNLLVATHQQNPTGPLDHLAVTRGALEGEHAARSRVAEVVDLLDLSELADRPVAALPFGTLRLVELARAIVTGAPLVMLDEPVSGLDNAETERMAAFLRSLRADLGLTILLIEHDVAMVTGVSDYMYVLDQGRLLAEGTPSEIQRDEDVIAAYLGRPHGDDAGPARVPDEVRA